SHGPCAGRCEKRIPEVNVCGPQPDRHEDFYVVADKLRRFVAEHPARGGIDEYDAAGFVRHHNAVRNRLDDKAEPVPHSLERVSLFQTPSLEFYIRPNPEHHPKHYGTELPHFMTDMADQPGSTSNRCN